MASVASQWGIGHLSAGCLRAIGNYRNGAFSCLKQRCEAGWGRGALSPAGTSPLRWGSAEDVASVHRSGPRVRGGTLEMREARRGHYVLQSFPVAAGDRA